MLKKLLIAFAAFSFAALPTVSTSYAASRPSVNVPGGEDEEGEHEGLAAVGAIAIGGAIVLAGAIVIRRRK